MRWLVMPRFLHNNTDLHGKVPHQLSMLTALKFLYALCSEALMLGSLLWQSSITQHLNLDDYFANFEPMQEPGKESV